MQGGPAGQNACVPPVPRFTQHALDQMRRRSITVDEVRELLLLASRHPGIIWPSFEGRSSIQHKTAAGRELRIIVRYQAAGSQALVISAMDVD